ncbi:ribonuclease R [Terripilifer ovatus]|uniref:ribonuclease R n=1 Tax=Terripilifer ovatus TaxID=3032367 RepID=UPI003AB92DEC
MAKKTQLRKAQEKQGALPTKAEILAFIAREADAAAQGGKPAPGKIGKREIARAFDIRSDDRIALKRLLREMEAEGALEKRNKHIGKPAELPAVVLCDIVSRDRDGDLIATPVEWEAAAQGPAPRIAIHMPRKPKRGDPTPGVGDRALVRNEIDPTAGPKDPAYRGRVIKLIARNRVQTIGVYRALPDGSGRLIPVDKKARGKELTIPAGAQGEARDGDLVAVEVSSEGRFGLPQARVRERLGAIDNERAITTIALQTHGIPHVFRPETLKEAESARAATMTGREDWRKLPLVTIDPADAKDHDDAVYAEPDDDPDNAGGFVLTVAIADVAAYVRPGTSLDREALERGNSVYFPDRVVPMLPERISNDLCSLRPHEDRPALAARMIIARDGRKLRHTFHRIMMRSAAKLAYPQAQAAIDGVTDDVTAPLLEPVLRPLWEAWRALNIAREQRSPLDLNLPERKLLLKPDGRIDRVLIPPRLDAHRLIEEYMILANVAAAETLEAQGSRLVYRAHDEPSIEKMHALGEFLSTIGVKLAKGQVLRPQQFNAILERVRDSEHENAVNEVVLRSQAQAEYSSENYGHFGLNLRRYAHFTSPIRRYADLIVHRALIRALNLGPDGLPNMEADEIAEIAARISAAERRAMAAERETNDRLIASFLSTQIGATFPGRISGVTRAGLFIKLSDTGADGFVPAATIGNDYYRYVENLHALVGNRTGETFRLGDQVEAKLVEAAPLAGALRFEIASSGRVRSAGSSRPGAAKSRKPRDKKPPSQKGRSRAHKKRSAR